jgi:hypothetical protein
LVITDTLTIHDTLIIRDTIIIADTLLPDENYYPLEIEYFSYRAIANAPIKFVFSDDIDVQRLPPGIVTVSGNIPLYNIQWEGNLLLITPLGEWDIEVMVKFIGILYSVRGFPLDITSSRTYHIIILPSD